jgi:hypothetical protein
LAELTGRHKQLAIMAGYAWAHWDGRYIVTNPEHECYCVSNEPGEGWTCTCVAFLRESIKRPETAICKHTRFVQDELARLEAEEAEREQEKQRRQQERAEKARLKAERQAARRPTAAALELEIATDFN